MYAYTIVLLEPCIVDTLYLSSGNIELCFASESCMQGFCFNLTLTLDACQHAVPNILYSSFDYRYRYVEWGYWTVCVTYTLAMLK